MFGLLVEYVSDERTGSDAVRRRFLGSLLRSLLELQNRFHSLAAADQLLALRSICNSVSAEGADDPVVEHLHACVEELERIRDGRAA
jgi:hypothetical protein